MKIKRYHETEDYDYNYECPHCKKLIHGIINYCYICGKGINWSDYEIVDTEVPEEWQLYGF